MSQPIDLSQFPDLPPEVLKAFAAIQFELSVERAARQHEQAVVAEKDAPYKSANAFAAAKLMVLVRPALEPIVYFCV